MTIYLTVLAIHVTCAAVWIGGNFFFVSLIRLLSSRKELRALRGQIIYTYAMTYRPATYLLMSIALVTGLYLLHLRGLLNAQILKTPLGQMGFLKIAFFALLIALQAFHDFYVGPRSFIREGDLYVLNEKFRRVSRILGQTVFLLSLLLLIFGIMLSRGISFT